MDAKPGITGRVMPSSCCHVLKHETTHAVNHVQEAI